jgi:hypothetical protein
MQGSRSSVRLFEKVDPSRVTRGAPPLVFHPTPDSYIEFKSPDEIKAWEDELRSRLGLKASDRLGGGTESCSGGCSDDCDQ